MDFIDVGLDDSGRTGSDGWHWAHRKAEGGSDDLDAIFVYQGYTLVVNASRSQTAVLFDVVRFGRIGPPTFLSVR
jgi:hypothetical protein